MKDAYRIGKPGEKINLTDPPDEEIQAGKLTGQVVSDKDDSSLFKRIIKFFQSKITGKITYSTKCKTYSELFNNKTVQEDPLILTEKIIEASSGTCTEEKSKFDANLKSLIEKRKNLLVERIKIGDVCSLFKVKSLTDDVVSKISLNDRKSLIENEGQFEGYVDVIHSDDFENPENSKYNYYLRNEIDKYELFSPNKLQLSLANSKVRMKGKSIGGKMAVGTSQSNGCGYVESSVQAQSGITGKAIQTLIEQVYLFERKNQTIILGGKKVMIKLLNVINASKARLSVDSFAQDVYLGKESVFAKEIKIYVSDIEYYSLAAKQQGEVSSITLQVSYSKLQEDIDIISKPKRPVDENLGSQKTLVIVANIGDNKAPVTIEEAKRLVFEKKPQTVQDYYINNSYGQAYLIGDVKGPYTLPANTCWSDTTNAVLSEAFKSGDLKGFNYDRLILAIPCAPGCNCYGGLGTLGKERDVVLPNGQLANYSISWDFSFDLIVVGHELGHNFGADHSNSYLCKNSAGLSTSFSYECSSNEYGDPFEIMGGGKGSFNAAHRSEVGWLPLENTKIVSVDGTYVLKPINIAQPLGSLQQLKIPVLIETNSYFLRKNIYYSLEFKIPSNYDNLNSVIYNSTFIRLALFNDDGTFTFRQTNIILPFSNKNVLEVGKSYIDSLNGYNITLEGIDASGARVNIKKIPKLSLPNFDKPLVHYDFLEWMNEDLIRDKAGYISKPENGEGLEINPLGLFFKKDEVGFLKMSRFPEFFIKKNNAFTFSLSINFPEGVDDNRLNNIYSMGFEKIFGTNGKIFWFKGCEILDLYSSYCSLMKSSTIISPNVKYHISGVYNGSNYILYVNGEREGSVSNLINKDVYIGEYGKYSYLGDQWNENTFIIDEFKIWARALNDSEIISEYKSFIPPKVISRPQSKVVNLEKIDVSGRLNITIQQLQIQNDYQTINEGESKIFRDLMNNLYSVKLVDTTNTTEAQVIIDGVQKNVTKSNYYEFSKNGGALTLYVDLVYHATKTGSLSSINFNASSSNWLTLNDKSILNYPVIAKANGVPVKLDAIFNPKGFSLSQIGKYRVAASFISAKGTKVESSWEFSVV